MIPFTLWFTGLSGAGKTTLATAMHTEFARLGLPAITLDGDTFRQDLCKDLGFSKKDREENLKRAASLALTKLQEGQIVLSAFISPYEHTRSQIRHQLNQYPFIEVFLDCTLEICEMRDHKGLYKKARSGLIPQFTGISDIYETPRHPELVLSTHQDSIDTCLYKIRTLLDQKNLIKQYTQIAT